MRTFTSLIVLFLIETVAFILFSCIGTDGNIIAASLSGIAIIGGYFITHYLGLLRSDDERKYNQYSNFLKSLRFLVLEKDLMGTEEQAKLRDELQHATFQAALLIDDKTYTKFKEMMRQFEKLLNEKDAMKKPNEKKIFSETQKAFVNILRQDYRSLSNIDFETWDFQLPEKK